MAIFVALLQGLYINSHAAFGLSNLRYTVKKNYLVHVNTRVELPRMSGLNCILSTGRKSLTGRHSFLILLFIYSHSQVLGNRIQRDQ